MTKKRDTLDLTLTPGQLVVVGVRLVEVSKDLARNFKPGDQLIGLTGTGELLHIPAAQAEIATAAVSLAVEAFTQMGVVEPDHLDVFFESFAQALEDEQIFAHIKTANDADVVDAKERGRSTTRLVLSQSMRSDMIEALRIWAQLPTTTGTVVDATTIDGMKVEAVRAPLGVVAFVFEGRPNVFADATGVLRSGNTVVFRIGGDALRTAEAIMEHAVNPSLVKSGLPYGAVSLVASRSHSAGWALFNDSRLSLAVARGSGTAVAQLGSIARQAGVPVSLHGTGGAWMIVSSLSETVELSKYVRWSLDRKVCNTLNVACVLRQAAARLLPVIADSVRAAAHDRKNNGLVHLVDDAREYQHIFEDHGIETVLAQESELKVEWEWEENPELSVVLVDSVEQAISLFNVHSPQFIISIVTDDESESDLVWDRANAPFVGTGFTRWVDGQFALLKPELGLSNWQSGRLLGRSGILSGDSVFSVRLRATQSDPDLHR